MNCLELTLSACTMKPASYLSSMSKIFWAKTSFFTSLAAEGILILELVSTFFRLKKS